MAVWVHVKGMLFFGLGLLIFAWASFPKGIGLQLLHVTSLRVVLKLRAMYHQWAYSSTTLVLQLVLCRVFYRLAGCLAISFQLSFPAAFEYLACRATLTQPPHSLLGRVCSRVRPCVPCWSSHVASGGRFIWLYAFSPTLRLPTWFAREPCGY